MPHEAGGFVLTSALTTEIPFTMISVIPLNDDREHESGETCWCNPMVEDGMVIHNSSDCRESVERLLGETVSEEHSWGIFIDMQHPSG